MKKVLLVSALLVSTMGALPAFAQTAGQAITGFLLNQGSTYNGFTCPAGQTYPCFVQYGSTIPVSGTFSASLSGFTPTAGATATLSASGTSADTALPAGTDIVVSSPSTNTVPVFVRIQSGAGTAVVTDQPVNPGAAIGFHISGQTHISAITSGTAATLQIQGGSGLATGYGGGGSGGGSGSNASVSGTGSAVPSSATYAGMNVSGNLTGLTGTANGLKVDGSAVTQPVSGTVTANIGTVGTLATAANQTNVQSAPGTPQTTALTIQGNASGVAVPTSVASLPLPAGAATAANQTSVIGTKAAGTAATNSLLAGGVYNSGGVTLTTGQQASLQLSATGNLLTSDTALQAIASSAIPAGTNVIGKVGIDQTTPGTTNGVQINAALPAGTNLVGKVGIDQTTPGTTNAVVLTATTTQGATQYGLQTAASTNATLVSTGAHTLFGLNLESTSTTVMFLRMYDTSASPTCSSSTGFIRSWAIPPASSAGLVGGITVKLPPQGVKFTSGLSFCVTGGVSSTDNTNATTGGLVNLDYQ